MSNIAVFQVKKSMRLLMALLLITGLFIQVGISSAAEFAVSPMLIEIDAKPDQVKDFTFNIRANSAGRVMLRPFDMRQEKSGHMGFVEADLSRKEIAASWVSLKKDRYRLRNGEDVHVAGKIKIPRKTHGTYLVSVMVEEDRSDSEQTGIAVSVRYAVILKVNVKGRRDRAKSKITDIDLLAYKGKLILSGMIANQSKSDHWVKATGQIRDGMGRLVEKVTMKTQSAWERNDPKSRLFPGAVVDLVGPIGKLNKPGEYHLLLQTRLGKHGQPSIRKKFVVTKEQLLAANVVIADENQMLAMSPGKLKARLRKNNTTFSSFTITNNGKDEVALDFPQWSDDSAIDMANIKGLTHYEFVPKNLVLAPNQRHSIILKQRFQEDGAQTVDYKVTYVEGGQSEQTLLVKAELSQ